MSGCANQNSCAQRRCTENGVGTLNFGALKIGESKGNQGLRRFLVHSKMWRRKKKLCHEERGLEIIDWTGENV